MATRIITVEKSIPHQTSRVELDGVVYSLALHWNERESIWYLDIADVDDVAILSGLKLVLNAPILRQFTIDRKPPGEIIALDATGNDVEDAGLDDLGQRVLLVYVEAADLPAE